jgi:ADP-ribose pyrophosphatase
MVREPKPWKLLSSKVLLDDEQLKVIKDTLSLPNGVKTTYVRLAPTETHSVIIIAVNPKDEVLIQREYSHPPGEIMWQLPGGSMKAGETPRAAALRELSEESGYSAKHAREIGYFYVHNRLSDKKQHIVLCGELFKRKLPEDEDEFIESSWMGKPELISKIKQGRFNNINLLAALNVWFCKQ